MENSTSYSYNYDKHQHMKFLTKQLAEASAQINVLRDLFTRTKQTHEAEVNRIFIRLKSLRMKALNHSAAFR